MGQPAAAADPGQRALNDPAAGQRLEGALPVLLAHDADGEFEDLAGVGDHPPGVATVGPDHRHARHRKPQLLQDPGAAVAVLHAGGGDHDDQHQPDLTRATISVRQGERRCDLLVCVKTASGATAVQIVHSSSRGSRDVEHLGSAHDTEELDALKAAARQRIAQGQAELDLGLSVAEATASGGPLEIASSRMSHLWDALCRAYDVLGFDEAAKGDEVFRQLVLARIIEPTSKQDSPRVR